jgi:hypothetical protein
MWGNLHRAGGDTPDGGIVSKLYQRQQRHFQSGSWMQVSYNDSIPVVSERRWNFRDNNKRKFDHHTQSVYRPAMLR